MCNLQLQSSNIEKIEFPRILSGISRFRVLELEKQKRVFASLSFPRHEEVSIAVFNYVALALEYYRYRCSMLSMHE